MIFTEFNMDDALEARWREGREEGREEVRKETCLKLLKSGMTPREISSLLGYSLDFVQAFANELAPND
jgi:hypothetical protein